MIYLLHSLPKPTDDKPDQKPNYDPRKKGQKYPQQVRPSKWSFAFPLLLESYDSLVWHRHILPRIKQPGRDAEIIADAKADRDRCGCFSLQAQQAAPPRIPGSDRAWRGDRSRN
jgi:hypothetical protein